MKKAKIDIDRSVPKTNLPKPDTKRATPKKITTKKKGGAYPSRADRRNKRGN